MPHLKGPNGQPTGAVSGPATVVPDTKPFETVYVKMVAWDSRLWGKSLAAVPSEQLGMTDTIQVQLNWDFGGPLPSLLFFGQAAIVPVPEPSVLALVFVAGIALLLLRPIR